MRPSELRLAPDRRCLAVIWPDGSETDFEARDLRRACRSSRTERDRVDGADVTIEPGLTITGIRSVGAYAVTIAFSDGHDRGIYPWAYLRELAVCERSEGEAPLADRLSSRPSQLEEVRR